MSIAVIGAGLFGISAALELSKKHSVDLYEKNPDILQAASGINQFRIHRGYHYPRSQRTVSDSLSALQSFEKQFGRAIIKGGQSYYCIAKQNSQTSARNFLKFCKKNDLEYKKTSLDLVDSNKTDLCVRVKETLIDPLILTTLCREKLKKSKVRLFLSNEVDRKIFNKYDSVVICTYANINDFLPAEKKNDYQFEICEKIVVRLPKEFKNTSIVILDGPFMCVDPYGKSGLFLLGNVVHAIHQTNIGEKPIIDKKFAGLLNKGLIKNPPISHFKNFIESGSYFIPHLKRARHVGSMFTIRTVLPNKERTDERPTLVEKIDDKVLTVFSGKLATCVNAAKAVSKMID